MSYSHARLHVALIVGVIAIGLALIETLSGEALEGYGQRASRSEEPGKFWKAVAIHCLCGVAGLGYYFYETFSNTGS
jgi:hypothetical protein